MCHKYVDILSDVIYIKGMIRRVFELISGMNDPNGAINEQETEKKKSFDALYKTSPLRGRPVKC